MTVSREQLVEMVTYALWRNLDLRPRRRRLEEARVWAERVVEHLERCGLRWQQQGGAPSPSTPGGPTDASLSPDSPDEPG